MMGMLSEFLRRWARPRVLALAGLLLAAGFGGGWVFAHHLGAPRIAYASARPAAAHPRLRPPPPAPAELQTALQGLADRFRDPVGLAVTDVKAGWTAQIAGDQVYPQQSVSKLWVALAVLQAVDDGKLRLDRQVLMGPADRSVFYQPLASRIRGRDGLTITIADLLRHALIESDNAANDKLIQSVGGAEAVTRVIAEKGLEGLAVGGTERDLQTRTAGLQWRPEYGVTWLFKQARAQLPDAVRDAAQAAYLAHPPDGATPIAIVTALAELERGELLSRASTDVMLELMGEARTGALRLKGGLAPGWTLAHKTGTGPDWRGASVGINDVGLLTAPDGRTYAVAVMIRRTDRPASARHALMQGVSRAVADQWRREVGQEARRIAAAEGRPEPGL